MPIRILDAATVGRIAAGEVVERPSSVVKELMENSLDAGATAITVEIRGGGIDYLRVTDNGCGIEPGQVRLAFENHATSKLQTADQLDDIRTLGFRGEALPSIAAVSHVEMTTRARGQDSGTRIHIDGGQNLRVQEIGCPDGTTFVMRDLFYNIPVRRAFLKKASYEGGLVGDAVARLLIGNPGVSVRFVNNGSTVYHSFGDGNLRHALFAVYGKQAEQMVEVDAAEGGTRIRGMIGVGELAKATRAHEMFFINGRSVRCAMLSRALETVCRSRVTIGLYPMCALNLSLPPNAIDVNVHPNKLEVRFRDEDMVRAAVEKLLNTAFDGERVLSFARDTAQPKAIERVAAVREIAPDAAKAGQGSGLSPADAAQKPAQMPPLPGQAGASPISDGAKRSTGAGSEPSGSRMDGAAAEAPRPAEKKGEPSPAGSASREGETRPQMPPLPGQGRAESEKPVQTEMFHDALARERLRYAGAPANSTGRGSAALRESGAASAPQPASSDVRTAESSSDGAADALPYRIVGVAFKTYIILEVGDTLLLIDQHAAHERIRYEMYMSQLEAGTASQQLLTPMVIRLSSREMALIRENLDVLASAGYEVEPFGEHDIQVRSVPLILGRAELRPLFMEMINSLGRLKSATIDARRAEVMQMACKSAVRGGDSLSESEIRALIREMTETGAPPTCPHGRPVVKAVQKRDLEKMFKRIQ